MTRALFKDRAEGGRKLVPLVKDLKGPDLIVLGIPRGGVVVAAEVAKALGAPLDIVVTRKIEAPGEPEYAIGAVTQEGEAILDRQVAESLGATDDYLQAQIRKKKDEVKERLERFRGGVPYPELKGKVVLLIDDGIATGSSVGAAVMSVKKRAPKSIVVGVPVAPPGALETLQRDGTRVEVVHTPVSFLSIGEFYQDFTQVNDPDVKEILTAFWGSRKSRS